MPANLTIDQSYAAWDKLDTGGKPLNFNNWVMNLNM
jgi:hypothetical protein